MVTQAAIEDHGQIGDLQAAALVSTDATIDWYCCPRFDSPSVFAAILDADRGDYFQIAPEGGEYRTKQLYLAGTAILITRFIMPAGVGEVVDFMPPETGAVTDVNDIVRVVRCTRGRIASASTASRASTTRARATRSTSPMGRWCFTTLPLI
jgi:GH15 family glucan-1,4-alpha-glucosidase